MGTEPMPDPNSLPKNPMAPPATIDSRVRAHARETASRWQVDHRPHGKGTFPHRAEVARQAFLRLNDSIEVMQDSSPLAELRGRARLLRSAIWTEPEETVPHLPRVHFDHGDEPRILVVAAAYLDATDSTFSWPSLRAYVDELQRTEGLNVDEIWEIPSALRFVLLECVLQQAGELASAHPGEFNTDLFITVINAVATFGGATYSAVVDWEVSLVG